jgi:alpha-galactosidase
MRQLTALFYEFRKVIEQSDPDGMLMICPCGNTMNHCLLPTENEPVTADPVGSEQIRWRVKMYKALMGPMAPVFADRVESTHFNSRGIEAGRDFPSCMGTGGVIGTIFIWPKIDKLPGDLEYRGELEVLKALVLTPDKDALWKKWFDLYHQKMLSNGEFLDLYTVGFDVPEGYAIRKDQKMYYAFFTPPKRPWGLDKPPELPPLKDQVWQGRLELRGLDKSSEYEVVDYEHGRILGSLKGSSPYLDTKFTNHLVLEVVPKS